jgi:hypothetical protein
MGLRGLADGPFSTLRSQNGPRSGPVTKFGSRIGAMVTLAASSRPPITDRSSKRGDPNGDPGGKLLLTLVARNGDSAGKKRPSNSDPTGKYW